jgi:hypothetical protein
MVDRWGREHTPLWTTDRRRVEGHPTVHRLLAGWSVDIHTFKAVFHRNATSIRVDDLSYSRQIAPQLFVLVRLAIDLVARVEHGGVVAAAELLADAQQ